VSEQTKQSSPFLVGLSRKRNETIWDKRQLQHDTMHNPFDSAFVTQNVSSVTSVASDASAASRFPTTIVGHEQSKYVRVLGGGGAVSSHEDGVTVGVYIPKSFVAASKAEPQIDESVIAAHGWKATFDSGKGKLYFSKLSDKSQRCWTLPAYEAAAHSKGSTKKPVKKVATTKKKATTKKSSSKTSATVVGVAAANASHRSGERHAESDDEEDEDREDGASDEDTTTTPLPAAALSVQDVYDPRGHGVNNDDDVFSRFGGHVHSSLERGGNVYDEDPFSAYYPEQLHHGVPEAHATSDDDALRVDDVAATVKSGGLRSKGSSSDSNADEESHATGVYRDDAHRSLSGRHLENASSQDIPDDAVPPLSSPMPQHLQPGMNTSMTTHPTSSSGGHAFNNSSTTNRRLSDDHSYAYTNSSYPQADDDDAERSAPPTNAAPAELNSKLAWLTHELNMLPEDETIAREDVLLIEATDRDALAYEAAAEFEDVCFHLVTSTTSTSTTAATSEVVGVLAGMIVEEADKFRRKEDAVQSELAVLIQKKVLDDSVTGALSTTPQQRERTALEELLNASTPSPGGVSEVSPPQQERVNADFYSNSPGHQAHQAPPVVCPQTQNDEDDESGFAPFPSFSQTSSATFAPVGESNESDEQPVASPVLRDEDFPISSLAKHVRNDSIYIAHHHDDHRDYVKDGIEHPEDHIFVPAIAGRRSSTSVDKDAGDNPSAVARRRRVSLDVNVASPGAHDDDRRDDDSVSDGSLHPTFVSSADLRGLSRYSQTTDGADGGDGAASPTLREEDFPSSTLAKHLRKDSIYVARHHREHEEYVKGQMIGHPDGRHHIASLPVSSLSPGSRHRRSSADSALHFDDERTDHNVTSSGASEVAVALSSHNNMESPRLLPRHQQQLRSSNFCIVRLRK
jgi:hypothetical protein